MIKENGLISKLLILVIILFLFGCNDNAINYEANNDDFAETISKFEDLNKIRIDELDLYYLNNYAYYDINYTDIEKDYNYHLLFIYYYNSFDTWFSLNGDSSELEEYCGTNYTDYLDAKQKGVHISYSQDDISEMFEKYQTE